VLLSKSLLLVISARTSLSLYTPTSRTVSLYHAFTVTSHLQLHGQLSVVVGERYQHTASCLRLVRKDKNLSCFVRLSIGALDRRYLSMPSTFEAGRSLREVRYQRPAS
jgi:hypothetical protein